MSVKATDAIPGKFYRRTRQGVISGIYYTRPALTADKLIKKLKKKSNPMTHDCWLMMEHKRKKGEAILMVAHHRVKDPFSGEKSESKRYVLIDPEYMFREVRTRPGYGK